MTARPCRGPHRCGEHRAADSTCSRCPPITGELLCPRCRAHVLALLDDREAARQAVVERQRAERLGRDPRPTPTALFESYVAAYLALERGQRYDVRQESEHGGRRGRVAHAPLPVDVEADALMRRILEVVLTWHEVVTAAAGLSGASRPRRVVEELPRVRAELVAQATEHPRLDGETERGEFAALRRSERVEAVDRPDDTTAGVALTTACRTLAAHLDVLLALPATAVTRTVSRPVRHVLRPVPATGDAPRWVLVAAPLLDDATPGTVRADGRAVVVRELDGVEAALELLALERDVRRTLGLSRGATVFDRPCPDCEEPGLVLLQGDDTVRCSSCGYECASDDWRRLELVLKSSRRVEGEAS